MYNRQLDTFILVADYGSMTKAAKELFITPASVMKQINSLEEELQVKLFNRTKHGMFLTSSGESIYKDAKKIRRFSQQAIQNAKALSTPVSKTIRVGTSILNPCKVLLDLWNDLSNTYPEYKIKIVPFEDEHEGILSVIESLGSTFDLFIGVCDSSQWLHCANFMKLGTYKKCISMSASHPLSSKKKLTLEDMHGETLMMVKPGDSPLNDSIRNYIQTNHSEIQIENADSNFYDIDVFNKCAASNKLLLNLECWKDVHPSLVTIPVNWDYEMPYGIIYPKKPDASVQFFLRCIKNMYQA